MSRRLAKRLGGGPPRALEVACAAKINIGWRVGPLRDDGYHEVAGMLQTVSVADTLSIRVRDEEPTGDVVDDVSGVPVALTVEGAEGLATTDNLVLRAARALVSKAEPRPTSITLTKRIPVAAGLGGGSADAAGTLLGLAQAWGARITIGDLVELAGEVSSDAPAILVGGLVHASGRGEVVRRIGLVSGTGIVLGITDARLTAAEVYAAFEGPTDSDRIEANDLEDSAAELCPEIRTGLEAMRAAGAPTVFVSGSGPTVVGITGDEASAQDVASRAEDAFQRVEVCRPTSWGVRLALRGGG